MRLLLSLMIGTFAMAVSSTAATILDLGFTNSPVSGVPGGLVTFSAQVTNRASVLENLNGDSFTLNGTPFTSANFNTAAFNNNWPLSLNPGGTYGPAAIFALTIPIGTTPGAYFGSFNILGGPAASDSNVIGSARFEVDVNTAVPEPATGVAILGGLAIVLIRRRTHQS